MLKVYLLRAPKHRWVFYADKDSFVPTPTHDTNKTTHVHGGKFSFQRAFTAFQASALSRVKEAKGSIDTATPGVGIKGRMRQIITRLEMHIHPYEAILHNILKAPAIEVVSPPIPDARKEDLRTLERRNRRVMNVLMKESAAQHKKWIVVNALLVPFTALATILPGPNIFLAWNLYRLYCHVQAYRGATLFIQKQAIGGVSFGVLQGISPRHHTAHHRQHDHVHTTGSENETATKNSQNINNTTNSTANSVDRSTMAPHHTSNNDGEDTVAKMAIQFNLPGFEEHVKKCTLHHKMRR